jgi:hypothetical protein
MILKNVVYLEVVSVNEHHFSWFREAIEGTSPGTLKEAMEDQGLSYIVNQNAPTRSPRLFISVVMWTMFRDTLTHAAAQAYDLSSIVLPTHCLLDT